MALFALLMLLCADLGVAVRRINKELAFQKTSYPEKFAQRFCLTSDVHLVCDDHSTINVYSAFYNRRKDRSCGTPAPITDEIQESCQPNFTSQILTPCNGKRECTLPPSMHPHCATKPFRHSRIVWFCTPDATAPPPEEEEEEQEELEEMEIVEDEHFDEEDLPTLPPVSTTALPTLPLVSTTTLPDVDIETVVNGKKVGKSKVMFCTSQPVKLTCPDGYGIDLYSAFYNTRRRASCEAHQSSACSGDVPTPTCGCGPNATDLVLKQCDRGAPSCVVQPDSHRFCEKMPFTFMRVVWDCIQGLKRSRAVHMESVSK